MDGLCAVVLDTGSAFPCLGEEGVITKSQTSAEGRNQLWTHFPTVISAATALRRSRPVFKQIFLLLLTLGWQGLSLLGLSQPTYHTVPPQEWMASSFTSGLRK